MVRVAGEAAGGAGEAREEAAEEGAGEAREEAAEEGAGAARQEEPETDLHPGAGVGRERDAELAPSE